MRIKDKEALATRIRDSHEFSTEEKSQLLGLLNDEKTFGLVWEDKPEEAIEILRTQIPILCEDTNRRIISSVSEAPNHILVEGDNLHALTALSFAYEGKVDAIYIDPPYNSGAKDWRYNNDYVDREDTYRHSKWLCMMDHRLRIAKRLLNPDDSVLIVTIDEKEYHHLGCLLEQTFPNARIQMVSTVINPAGVARDKQFSRSDEYIYFVEIGSCAPTPLPLADEWFIKADSQFKSLYWRSLSRAGSNDSRSHSPGCFYPIFVFLDGSKIHSVGDSIPIGMDRNTVVAPQGTVAIWPIHSDGKEGCWMQSASNLRTLIKKGYVRLGGFTSRGMAIKYLNKKEIEKVEGGLFEVLGNREDGSIITDDNDAIRNVLPTTQWRISSHNARSGGSEVIKEILGGKYFSFPKSVHAVHDALRFFVEEKTDALILDFFAGSGTTLHATMMLNAEDGGNRQCILVTNNENKICEEVTYERNKRVILGYTTLSGKTKEGLLSNNLRYYRVNFIKRQQNSVSRTTLMEASTDILMMKENLYAEHSTFAGLKLPKQAVRYFAEGDKQMLVIYNPIVIPHIAKAIAKAERPALPIQIYVMSEGQYPYTDDFAEVLDRVELHAMPASLYQAYRHVLPKKAESAEIEGQPEVSEQELAAATDDIFKAEDYD